VILALEAIYPLRKDSPLEIPVVPWDDRGPGHRVRVRTKCIYWL
jgi:hypothetical protein